MRRILILVAIFWLAGCAETKVRKRSVKESASLRYVQKVVEADRIERKAEIEGINSKLDEIKALLTPKE